MTDLQLHPTGILHLTDTDTATSAAIGLTPKIAKLFAADWRTGLITLAGTSGTLEGLSLSARFWHTVSSEFLTHLCHQPHGDTVPEVPKIPSPASVDFQHWVDTAPPIPGGEYLSPDILSGIWDHLNNWVAETVAESGGLEALLTRWAPAWQRVGRVTFHLAENKAGAAHPFAFLATFTTGLGSGGHDKHLPLAKALKLYAGSNNRNALVKLLTPVREAERTLDWVADMVESGDVYRPSAWTAAQAHLFLQSMPELEQAGLVLRIPDWWHQRSRAKVEVQIDKNKNPLLGAESLLDMDVKVMLGDQELGSRELKKLMSGPDGLVLIKGRWIEVDKERLQEVLDYWEGVADSAAENGLSFHEGLRLLAGAPADLKSGPEYDPRWSNVVEGKNLRELLGHLRNPAQAESPRMTAKLRATLRPYQHEGVSWLSLMTELGLGACLADDMGLGKTIQMLALLAARRRQKNQPPSLLVAPASLLGNWRAEALRFTPKLKLLVLHPSQTPRDEIDKIATDPQPNLARYDLVITTYTMAHRLQWLADLSWHSLILDEAQAIKNHGTRQSKAVRKLKAVSRVALTGTPVENNLGDLWSLFDFLNPGLLGSKKVFKDFIGNLEESGFEPLRRLVGPYILRRLKSDRSVIADLPEKTETVRFCNLTTAQVRLYKKVVDNLARGLESLAQGMERRGLVLQTLTRLKQVCNHPSQLTGDQQYDSKHSGKFTRLAEICTELKLRQEKVLVFTQYKEIIPHLEEHLTRVFGRPGLTLHGGTSVKKRPGLVAEFQEVDGPPFFVISLKAGGTGLNLTQACHVIHFDRWWNPAVENQATDRAFRIGQKQNVLVHKFVTTGTVEEKIDQMINDKKALAEQVLTGGEIKLTEMSDRQLLEIVKLDVNTI